ncbi:MAG TPA: hypothetical protein VMR16_03340, partial [Candidatus Saccharimonadales bacterium]|nr:hypothetical protein [Candidatus Saccharimonadales bacterium]
ENALNRELKEELNIKASVNELFTSYTFENQDVSNYLVAAPKNIRPSAEIDKIYWASKNDIENDVIKVSRGFSDNAFATLVDSHLL